jgi:glycosyltransferase involved in cell wall biosynthesis
MPRFSICIPTRERHETLKSTIETVLAQTFSDFELVIQDNFSSPTTAELVRSFDDPRIVYARSNRRLAMHENWELAVSRTRGDYIIVIGDDDAMMPDCLYRANEIYMNERPDVMFSMSHLYYWPDVPDIQRRNYLRLDYRGHFEWREAFLDKPHTKLTSDYPLRTPGTAFLDHEAMLRNILTWSNSRLYVSVYHGFVSRALVDRVKAANGGIYFLDLTPDFASMVVNLYYATSVLFSAKSFTITGQSGKSNGGNAGSARDLRKAADRFVAESSVTFERLLPTVFPPYLCPLTVVAGCYEAVKQKSFPHDDRFKIDWKRCLAVAAAETMQQPAEDRDAYRQWVLASADRLGMDAAELVFSVGASDEAKLGVESDRPTSAWKRLSGVDADRLGRLHYIHVDGDRYNLKTIVDAVAVAHSFSPVNTFAMDIRPSLTAEPLGAEEPWLTPVVETKALASQSDMSPTHTTDWVLFMSRIRRNLSEAWKRIHNI